VKPVIIGLFSPTVNAGAQRADPINDAGAPPSLCRGGSPDSFPLERAPPWSSKEADSKRSDRSRSRPCLGARGRFAPRRRLRARTQSHPCRRARRR
jgi:hypothetical protein